MSAEEERQVKALRLLEYVESKQKLALLQSRAGDWANKLHGLGKLMRENPGNIAVESYAMVLDFEKFGNLVADIRTATNDEARHKELIGALGISV